MHILKVHNRYQIQGGEEAVYQAETSLLRDRGQEVTTLEVSNKSISEVTGILAKASLAARTIWSRNGFELLSQSIRESRPDVVHFDNTFPLLSPAVYSAARKQRVAVVKTLHNYRLICPNGMLLRDGAPCEDCVGKAVPFPGVVHACYRGSRVQSGVVGSMLGTHRLRGTWKNDIDRYIALTEFARSKFIEGGIPAELIEVKPNFLTDQAITPMSMSKSFLFVGRLSHEKGLDILLDAQRKSNVRLRIAGEGPLESAVRRAAIERPEVSYLGKLNKNQVLQEMQRALAVVVPSIWYETFGLVTIESYSAGAPVIASRLGALEELVKDGVTGLLFDAHNSSDLARILKWAVSHPREMERMASSARSEFEAKYTADINFPMLMEIYARAIAHSQQLK